jgi:hypothetical protein
MEKSGICWHGEGEPMISIMVRSSASWKFIALKLDHISHFGHHTPSLAANSHSVAVFGPHAAKKLGPRSKKRSFSTQKRASE